MNTIIFIVLLLLTVILTVVFIYFTYCIDKGYTSLYYYLRVAQYAIISSIFITLIYGWYYHEEHPKQFTGNRSFSGL